MQGAVTLGWLLVVTSVGCGRIGFAPVTGDAPPTAIDARQFQLDAGECPPGYQFNDPSCYRYGGDAAGVLWTVAEAICEADGAHLVIVDSAAEAVYIDGLPGGNSIAHWVGTTDRVTEGTLRHVTGTTPSFLPWSPGEPDGGTAENCVEFLDSQQLGTTRCDLPNEYLCEYDGAAADPSAF
jgi:hypothetical protein